MSGKLVRFPGSEQRRVTMVRDWRAMTPEDVLRLKVPADFSVAEARAAWSRWSLGDVHEMPTKFVDKKEYKQFVRARLGTFDELRKKGVKHPDFGIVLEEWPEWGALQWSKGKVHHSKTFAPTFIPGHHEQNMKKSRQSCFWNLLEIGSAELLEWPEYVSLCREAGFKENEKLPLIRVARPYLPQPRQTASKTTKRRYRKLQQRWEAAYGPARKTVVKALKRTRRRLQLQAAVA